MKIESIALAGTQNASSADLPIMKADAIKAILYLGIRGDIKLDAGKSHTVDMYA